MAAVVLDDYTKGSKCYAQSNKRIIEKNSRLLRIQGAISRWDEALPLGNGMYGCLVWGDGDPLYLSLDRADLWDTRMPPEALAPDYTYEELVKLVQAKEWESIKQRYQFDKITPTKIPAGRIEMRWGCRADEVDNCLLLEDAQAKVTLRFGSLTAHLETFLHAEEQIGYIHTYY